MKYVSWNCRGLGSKLKEDALKDIVRMYSPEILLIQETKMEEIFLLNTSKSFWRKGIGCAVSARGASGGIATFWDSTIYDLLQKENSAHWIFTKFLHKDSGQQVSLFNIYSPVLHSDKKLCWDSISSFLSLNNPENIIIAGDMNVTLAANEKRGGTRVRDPAREWVEDLILGWDLEDIKPSSGKFTWSNRRVGPNHIAARLDRFLVQSSFLSCGLMASSKILSNSTSDHKPIILELFTEENLGPIPFRFSSLWLQHEGFQEMVADVWNRPVQGSPFYVWEEKLRRLKRRLKDWARTLKSPSSNRKAAMDNLAIHQMLLENTEVTQDLLQREIDLQKDFHKASREEEENWRQKSRALWLQAGDKNTSFFHKHAEARKQFKSVKEIHHHDVVVKDFEEIKRAAHDYFKDLYSAPQEPPLDPQIYPMNMIPHCVQDPTNAMLMAPISMNELRSALDSMEPDKAPGPDGFPVRFYLSCWDIISADLLRMVKKSQSCSKIGGGINSAFLALIPKEKGAANFSRFRPISLCNSSYKLITKIIANRLKKILPAIIPENQGGFIKGRKILDNIVLVQEAVHSSWHRKEKGMVIKLDLANAFDRVKHEFLFMVMEKMGFSPAITKWIKACIAFPWIAPLVNGRPADFFQASRGLRQGCPLSPLLYAIQASVLSFQLDHNLHSQILPGLRMVHQVKDINHAQFADDTLLLGGASIISANSFKKELDSYREVSGSKINYSKSIVYSWNCSARELSDIARILQMEGSWKWDSFKYLGIPIFRTISKVAHWTPLLDKIKNRIHAWGASWLNNAGKIILMKAVLSSLPLYQHSILLAPKTFINKMEVLLRRFLWEGGKNNERRLHLVKWDTIKKPFMEGGLQIRDLATQNMALGTKLLWDIVSGKISWSKKVLWRKYFHGKRLRCLDHPPRSAKGSPVFNLCIKAWDHFSRNLYWIPGNGRKIRIWDDPILGDQPMNHEEGISNIRDWLQDRNLNTLWDISSWSEDGLWERWQLGEVPQWLEGEASVLLDKLQGKAPVKASSKDKRGWGSVTGSYSASEGYKSISAIPNVPPNPAQWHFIWGSPSLPKIDFFCWTLAHNSILTRDNLRRRGMEGPSWCNLCKSEEETADHLFLTCSFALEVWKGVLMLNADNFDLPRNIQNLFQSWSKLSPYDLSKNILLKNCWLWIPKFVCWKLWLERNNRIFRNESCNPLKVITKIKALLGETLDTNTAKKSGKALNREEERWLNSLVPSHKDCAAIANNVPSNWEIRLEEQEFIKWRSALNEHCLFFDGASKGNPGFAGGGGVLLCPNGSEQLRFAWGLGKESNNRAEALALWQGLSQAIKGNVRSISVFGDSRIIIQALHSKKNPSQLQLSIILRRIKSFLPKFHKISFYHILRNLNSQADLEANQGVLLSKGSLSVNQIDCFCNIP